MLSLEVRKYLFDIKQAGDLLAGFTAGKTFADYCEGYDDVGSEPRREDPDHSLQARDG
jgi:hypothetical protein